MNDLLFNNGLFNTINDNIMIYNGDALPDNIRDSVTLSIENLFNKSISTFDQKIYRSKNCIWYIISKNIPEYYIVRILKNTYAKATNKEILKNALINYPYILQNIIIPSIIWKTNLLENIQQYLVETPDNANNTFDILE